MPCIGPQLPPHLSSVQRNEGSSASSGSESGAEVTTGPQISQEIQQDRTATSTKGDCDEEDAYGPALPPELLVSQTSGPSKLPSTKEETTQPLTSHQWRRCVPVGPTLPGRGSYGVYGNEGDEKNDDDDSYGPMPPPVGGHSQSADGVSEGVREFLESETRRRKEAEEAAKPKQLQREEWMLVPPSSSDLLGHLSDPTKLKARQFSRGGIGSANRSAPNNLWTETPVERQQRIADEVAGKKGRAANPDLDPDVADGAVGAGEGNKKRKRRDEEIRMVIEEHNRTSRGKSLLELHEKDERKGKGKGKGGKRENGKDEDEGPGAIWDHARDMAPGGRLMDEKDRSKLIADARSLGDRFGSGKGGSYL